MIKHVLISSLQGALVTTIFQFIVLIFSYGTFGYVLTIPIFPIAFILCVLLGTPLILLKRYCKTSEPYYLILFVAIGLIFGTLSPSIFFGENISLKFIIFGLGGVVASTTLWLYVRRVNL